MPDPSTTRLALYKSKSDGSELVNYTQDIGQNWDKVDAAAGFQAATSSTRPSTPYSGKPIFETDTFYRTLFSNGTSPASASWVEIPNSSATFNNNLKLASGKQVNIGASGSSASYTALLPTATGDYILASRVTADSVSRLTIRADGRLDWSSGAATQDTNLFRDTANVLRTNDSLTVDLNLTVSGNITVAGIGQTLFARKTGDTSRASTTTQADDPHLTVSLTASATYLLYAYLVYQAGTTGDINVGFTIPSGAAGSWQGTGIGRDVVASVGTGGWTVRMNANDVSTTQLRSYGGDTTNQVVQVMGIVRTSSAGAFTVQWAQAAIDATATILRTDSWMQLTRVA
ncbi:MULTISPECIES: hypothetical protein [Streptomyces]|uniref:Uncharacterized protein n=1 Tax=Streptomyces dengpaensis TaxID=2049881 RepID=A0ABN5ICN2_9ACTN|nr:MULTISPECIES: hypothetical protein [Streptomyces]AVH60015.1 hypothetical protein C4B68_34255 [Streptomyces dengpaensis]PIB09653.1 hypothetical protein B1C81_10930 [Streptomyces sp. HG99]